MPDSVQMAERRWFRIGEQLLAALLLGMLAYGVAVSRAWIPGNPPLYPNSTLLRLAASACLATSFVARRRSPLVALGLVILCLVLVISFIVTLGRGH